MVHAASLKADAAETFSRCGRAGDRLVSQAVTEEHADAVAVFDELQHR